MLLVVSVDGFKALTVMATNQPNFRRIVRDYCRKLGPVIALPNSYRNGIAKNCENFSSRPEADRPSQKDSQGEHNSARKRVCAPSLATVFAYCQ